MLQLLKGLPHFCHQRVIVRNAAHNRSQRNLQINKSELNKPECKGSIVRTPATLTCRTTSQCLQPVEESLSKTIQVEVSFEEVSVTVTVHR